MKKQLLALALLGMGISKAQVWSENFNSTTAQALPAGWLQNNVDNLTVASQLSSFNFGTNAWVTNAISTEWPNQGRVVMSTSWYNPAGTSNDWLITPQFTVPAGGYLEWVATCVQSSFADGYQVKISTTGTTTASFATNLLTVPAEVFAPTSTSLWNERSLNLSAYVGQSVRIAFVNNSNDKNRLYLDDIKCVIPPTSNGNVLNITGLPRYMAAGSTPISGTFKNKGTNPANNATLNYQIDAGPIVTQTISFSSLAYLATAPFTFTANANLTAGTHTVKVFVTAVNGVAETITTDDQQTSVVYVASQTKTRNSLVEEWSSSTCAPCAALNVSFDPMLNGNNPNTGGTINVVKYQVNWPSPYNDPSYNMAGADRVNFYGINAAPTAIVDGVFDMVAHSQAEINTMQAKPAFAAITASISLAGNNITASSSFTPYVSTTSLLRVYQVLAQKSYSFANPSTSQTNFYHVMRAMSPDGQGSPITTVDGTPQTANMNHTATYQNIITSPMTASNTANFWNGTTQTFEYVVWLQDDVSGDILQSGSASISNNVGIVELKNDAKIGVYPNPAKDHATVAIKLNNASMVDIMIMDVTGKVVYTNKGAQVGPGQNEINIVTSEFANGTYNIVVKSEEGTMTEKLIINK